MPFVELLAPPIPAPARARAARAVTDGLCEAFGIAPDIVTLFFLDVSPDGYAHAGAMGPGAAAQRLFVKLHAFRRDVEHRRRAAALLAPALAEAYGVPAGAVALYFLEREADEVSHAGRLASEHPA